MSTEIDASSLDDFFAKKDKKKTKKTKNVATDLSTLSQAGEQQQQKKKKPKDKTASGQRDQQPTEGVIATDPATATAAAAAADEKPAPETPVRKADDWIEYEEKEDKDYSGLKIQSLRLGDKTEAEKSDAAKNEEEEGGTGNGAEGPWKKMELAPVVEKETTEVVSESRESTPTIPGKYVPPSVRAAQRQASQQSSAPTRKRNNKLAPDVTDQEMFPTLGGGSKSTRAAASTNDTPKSYTSLHLQNKWDSLSRGSSES